MIERATYTIDAEGKTLGRLATRIALLLRGKHKADFAPHRDGGDIVRVYNVEKIFLSGTKWDNTVYYRHLGYPGGLSARTAREMHTKDSTFLLRHAVAGMLPKNRLRAPMLRRLLLEAGPMQSATPNNRAKPRKRV